VTSHRKPKDLEIRVVAERVQEAVDVSELVNRLEKVADSEVGSHRQRFAAIVDRIQRRMPPNVTPEEIESDITAARQEVRDAHRRRRSAGKEHNAENAE